MKQYRLTCSVDGINIDFECIIEADTEPSFWECYAIAEARGCEYFMIAEL